MAIKYKLKLKDLKLQYLIDYLKPVIKYFKPKEKITNYQELKHYIQKKISLGDPSYLIWIFENKNGSKICFDV